MHIHRQIREAYAYRTILWPRLRVRPGTPQSRQVIVATAGRVGSTWTCNLLRGVGLRAGMNSLPKACKAADGTLIVDDETLALLEAVHGVTWFKSHSRPPAGYDPVRQPTVRFVTVLREPRDVLVSAADFLTWLDPKFGGRGPAFAALPEADRILELIETGDAFLDALERWQQWPHAVQIHYEDMLSDPTGGLGALLDACDLVPRHDAVARAVRRYDFAAQTGRKAGDELKGSFRRKGIAGDWRAKFDARCMERFATAKQGRWLRLAERIEAARGS